MSFLVNGAITIINSSGNMGIGTLTPAANLAIVASSANALILLSQSNTSTPALNVAAGEARFHGGANVLSRLFVTGAAVFSGGINLGNVANISANTIDVNGRANVSQLNVSGSIQTQALFVGSNTVYHSGNFSTGSNTTSDSTVISVDSSAKRIGVNKVQPNATVDVAGTVEATGTVNSAVNMFVNGRRVWHEGTLDVGANTVWHAGNDGAGSGLDADLLDGLHASAFANASNLTSGTVPAGRLSGGSYSVTSLTVGGQAIGSEMRTCNVITFDTVVVPLLVPP